MFLDLIESCTLLDILEDFVTEQVESLSVSMPTMLCLGEDPLMLPPILPKALAFLGEAEIAASS